MSDEKNVESEKNKRRMAIKDLVLRGQFKSITEIKVALALTCDKSTIFRDLKVLSITKSKSDGKFYELPDPDSKIMQDKILKNIIDRTMDQSCKIHDEVYIVTVRTKRGLSAVFAREIMDSFQGNVISALPLEESVIVFTNDMALKTGIIDAMSSAFKVK